MHTYTDMSETALKGMIMLYCLLIWDTHHLITPSRVRDTFLLASVMMHTVCVCVHNLCTFWRLRREREDECRRSLTIDLREIDKYFLETFAKLSEQDKQVEQRGRERENAATYLDTQDVARRIIISLNCIDILTIDTSNWSILTSS